jgi:PAS domain S-box-containing protein
MEFVLVVQVEDATHRHKLEHLAKAQRDLAESLIQSVPFLVLLADPAGRVLKFNQAGTMMSGFSEADFGNRTWFEVLVPPEDHELLRRRLEQLHRNESKPVQHETGALKRAGLPGQMHWTICPLRGPAYDSAGMLVIGQELFDRKQEVSVPGQTQAGIITSLANGLCHDLQKEATLLEALAGLLFGKSPAEGPAQQVAEQVLASARRLSQTNKRLASLLPARRPRTQAVDLNRVLAGQTEALARLAGQNIHLSVDLCDEPCCVNVEPERLEQVILAMVANACQAMPGGGHLTMETSRVPAPGALRYEAKDSFDDHSPTRAHTDTKRAAGQIMLAVTGHGFDPGQAGRDLDGDE